MIVWTGLGFLIAIIGIGALVGTQMISESITGSESFYQDNQWVMFFGMLVAAVITYVLNKTLLSPESKAVLDKETGEEIVLKKEHSLFFISTKWWPVIFVGFGIIAVVMSFTSG